MAEKEDNASDPWNLMQLALPEESYAFSYWYVLCPLVQLEIF